MTPYFTVSLQISIFFKKYINSNVNKIPHIKNFLFFFLFNKRKSHVVLAVSPL